MSEMGKISDKLASLDSALKATGAPNTGIIGPNVELIPPKSLLSPKSLVSAVD